MLKAEAAAEKPDLIYGQTLIDEIKAIKASAERLREIHPLLKTNH